MIPRSRASLWLMILAIFVSSGSVSQEITPAVPDSQLTYNEFLYYLINHHPLAKQAKLREQLAPTFVQQAWGQFDPVLTSGYDEKQFDDKLYYRHFSTKLRIPAVLGIDVVGEYAKNNGDYLNPEYKTDDDGLWSVGLEANVLQGLITDKRRTELRKARLYQAGTLLEQQLMLNALVLEASQAYTNWQQAVFVDAVLKRGAELAQSYSAGVTQSFLNGEKSAIDTLEASIFVQDRLLSWQGNRVKLVKAQRELERFLWMDQVPMELQPGVAPEAIDSLWFLPEEENQFEAFVASHPKIIEKELKLQSWELTQKLRQQTLLPKLKVKYSPLMSNNANSQGWTSDNYKWGVAFSMPVFLREERAGIKQASLELQSLQWGLSDQRLALTNKIKASKEQAQVLSKQIDQQSSTVMGYELLMKGEYQKFLFGESSLFLLTKRQEKFIDGQIKLIEVQAKYRQELLNYRELTNRLWNYL